MRSIPVAFTPPDACLRPFWSELSAASLRLIRRGETLPARCTRILHATILAFSLRRRTTPPTAAPHAVPLRCTAPLHAPTRRCTLRATFFSFWVRMPCSQFHWFLTRAFVQVDVAALPQHRTSPPAAHARFSPASKTTVYHDHYNALTISRWLLGCAVCVVDAIVPLYCALFF